MDENKDYLRMQFYADKILKGYQLQYKDMMYILNKVTFDILKKEPPLLNINPPVYIAGGIGGNFDDIKSIFEIGGPLPYTTYLFLGNFSEETGTSINSIMLLLVYKYIYKDNIFLVQGTNEKKLIITDTKKKSTEKEIPVVSKTLKLSLDREIVYLFGKNQKSEEMQKYFSNAFLSLPLAAVVGQLYFCTDNSFKFPTGDQDKNQTIGQDIKLGIENLRTLNRIEKSQYEGISIENNVEKFLSENKLSLLIEGLNLSNIEKAKFEPSLMKIYSSPHTTSKDCYVIEINEHKIANPIRMIPLVRKSERVFDLPNELFIC